VSAEPKPNARDWAAYNRALIERGSLTVWIDEDAFSTWLGPRDTGTRGRPFVYSDSAVEMVLTLRELYRLPLRSAQGFARSIFRCIGVALPVPDYSTLSRRAGRLAIDLGAAPASGGRVLLIDSTGMKVFGEGEWKVRQHGYSKRRTWRKLHLAVDAATQEVVAVVLTGNAATDAAQVPELFGEVDEAVEGIKADGAYDQESVYEAAKARGAVPVIPPRRGAVIHKHGNKSGPKLARDENVRGVRRYGRKRWKQMTGYHERSLSETAMFRVKSAFGGHLKHRLLESQRVEARIKCKILNRFTRLGLLTHRR